MNVGIFRIHGGGLADFSLTQLPPSLFNPARALSFSVDASDTAL
jgi:hypothetical protein